MGAFLAGSMLTHNVSVMCFEIVDVVVVTSRVLVSFYLVTLYVLLNWFRYVTSHCV